MTLNYPPYPTVTATALTTGDAPYAAELPAVALAELVEEFRLRPFVKALRQPQILSVASEHWGRGLPLVPPEAPDDAPDEPFIVGPG